MLGIRERRRPSSTDAILLADRRATDLTTSVAYRAGDRARHHLLVFALGAELSPPRRRRAVRRGGCRLHMGAGVS